MINIVSIDFDIIMAPSIELYNNIIGPGKWENNFQKNHQLMLSQADLAHYQRLTQWLLKALPKIDKKNIYFILDHEVLVDCIPKNEEEIIITNIDHHHDISYNKENTENIIDENHLTCGNWVKYLHDAGKLKRYYWINNANSAAPTPDVPQIITNTTDLRDFNFNTLAAPDILVICLSPMWVPPVYRNLFYTWMDLCNFLHNTFYNIKEKE